MLPRRLAALACLLLAAACADDPDIIGIDNPEFPAATVEAAKRHRVFVATTRLRSADEGELFSGQRAERLGLAGMTVSLPPDHRPGRISRPRALPPDPRHEVTVTDPVVYDADRDFIDAINAELARRPAGERDILLFVHGFNNSLSDAVLRMTQFVQDSGFPGVPVLFSWASADRVSGYVYDMNSVLAARGQVENASAILTRTNARAFDVFAHSMGSLLVTEAMVQSDIAGTLGRTGRLSNVMLAAPDIDIHLFRSQLRQIRNNPGNIYVFLSHDDAALRAARRISGGVPRAGAADARLLAGLGVTVIDLTDIQDRSSLAHSKYATSPAVVRLIGDTLREQSYEALPTAPALVEIVDGIPVLRRILN